MAQTAAHVLVNDLRALKLLLRLLKLRKGNEKFRLEMGRTEELDGPLVDAARAGHIPAAFLKPCILDPVPCLGMDYNKPFVYGARAIALFVA